MTRGFTAAAAAAAMALGLAAGGPAAAQDADADAQAMAEALMSMDGSGPDAGVAAATGWHTCDVIRTGAGWGNHYAALTCPSGGFTNKWHILNAGQKDAMLATALAAATSEERVQVYIQAMSSGYNEIRALYLRK
jgi:hypothetical protein